MNALIFHLMSEAVFPFISKIQWLDWRDTEADIVSVVWCASLVSFLHFTQWWCNDYCLLRHSTWFLWLTPHLLCVEIKMQVLGMYFKYTGRLSEWSTTRATMYSVPLRSSLLISFSRKLQSRHETVSLTGHAVTTQGNGCDVFKAVQYLSRRW